MFFKEQLVLKQSLGFFCIFAIFFFNSSAPAQSLQDTIKNIAKNGTCARIFNKYSDHIFKGSLGYKETKDFFKCIRDGLEIFIDYTKPGEERDYYKKSDLINFFVHLEFTEEESYRVVTQFLSLKTLLVGGNKDQLEELKLEQMYKLTDTYRDFVLAIRRHIKVLRKVFISAESGQVPSERLDKALHQLKGAFSILEKSFIKHKVEYELKNIKDIHHLFYDAQLIDEKTQGNWSTSSVLLEAWAQGVLNKSSIKGQDWNRTFSALHDIISQYSYHEMYVSGQDISQPEVFSKFLKGVNFFLSSLQQKKGFPIKSLDKLIYIFLNQSNDLTQDLDFPARKNKKFIALFTRSLFCFVFQPQTKMCKVEWQKNPTDLIVRYRFPDGEFNVYKDHQEWKLDGQDSFLIFPEQLAYLKNWVLDWSDRLSSTEDDFLLFHEKRDTLMQAWFQGFTSQDKKGRIVFGAYPIKEGFFNNLKSSFALYDSLIRFFFHSYILKQDEPFAEPFSVEDFQLSKDSWATFVDELSPVISAFYADGYEPSFKENLISLFDYADNALNTSNHDSRLQYSELIDASLHLSSARANSKKAFDFLNEICPKSQNTGCYVDYLFDSNELLSNFPILQAYTALKGKEVYTQKAQELLGETIAQFHELIPLFLLLQPIEYKFHALDQDKNTYLSWNEISPFLNRLSGEIVDTVPFIENSEQALGFLSYSAKQGFVPFFKEDPSRLFQFLEFYNWTLHQEKWLDVVFFHFEVFSLSVDLYNLKN